MEGALKRKLRSFLSEQRVLQTQYLRLKEETEGQDLEAREDLAALYEFDQLVYSYNAIKSYYDVSKSHWAFSDRQPFDLFGDLIPKTEAKLHLGDLCDKHNGLQVLRRQLKDNAKEGGKLAHLMMSSSANPEDLKSHSGEIMAELSEIPVSEPMGNSLRAWSPSVPKKAKGQVKMTPKSTEKDSVPNDPIEKASVTMEPHQEVPVIEKKLVSFAASPAAVKDSATSKSNNLSVTKNLNGSIGKLIHTSIGKTDNKSATTITTKPPKVSEKETVSNGTKKDEGKFKMSPEDPFAPTAPAQPTARRNDVLEIPSQPARKKQKNLSGENAGSSLSNGADKSINHFIHPVVHLASQKTTHSTSSAKPSFTSTTEHIEISRPQIPATRISRDGKDGSSNLSHANHVSISRSGPTAQGPEKTLPRTHSLVLNTLKEKTSEGVNDKSPQASKVSSVKEAPRGSSSDKGSFAQFPTWSKDYVRCIVKAAASQPHAPAKAIQSALQEKCKIIIRFEEAEMLRLHYGLMEATMDNYEYYIQTFHLVATQFSEKRSRYVTIPWSDMRVQFARASRLQLEDWDIKGRYSLFRLHCRVYGKQGEPSSNYRDEVEAFKKRYTYRRRSSFLKVKNNVPQDDSPAASVVGNTSSNHIPKEPSESTENNDIWSPKLFKALVDGYCLIPPETTNKALALVQYIRLKIHTNVELERVLEKCKSKEFIVEVRRRHPNENEASINKFLAQAASANVNLLAKTSQLDIDLRKMASQEQPDYYYKAKFKKDHLSDFWDFGKTKCIMSTVEYASSIPPDTKVPHFKAIRGNVLKYIKLRLLNEHKVHIPHETVKTRIVRMMELDMFDKAQCLLLNEIIHKH